MKHLLVVLFLVSYLLFCGCDSNDPNNSQNNKSPVSYKDIPCGSEGLFKPAYNDGVNLGWVLNNNILNLDFHYFVTCGSAFSDSITFQNNILSINLKDTSASHAKCRCNHGTQVAANVGTQKEIRILLSIMRNTKNEYNLKLDTLLVLRK